MDEIVLRFLMGMITYVAKLHHRITLAKDSQQFHDESIPWEEEGFSRWMGWRGEEEQEREIRKKREK